MTNKLNYSLLWVSIAVYVVYYGSISVLKFFTFSYYDFDLAVHSLTLWNILNGSIYNSILGIPFLGNHMHLILFLVGPIYALFTHPITLLLLQTLALGMGALPVYKLSKKLLSENLSLIVSIVYLIYPALGFTNLFEFHPTVFATFFLLWAIYYYETDGFRGFLLFSFLSMLCQENIPFAIIMFGALAALSKRRLKWIIFPVIMGGAYLLLALSWMSFFNNNTVQYSSLYSHILPNPASAIGYLTRKECLIYFFNLLLPISFLALLASLKLLPALPFFLQHMLSIRPQELTLYYHYNAEVIPFIFLGLIFALGTLSKSKIFKARTMLFKSVILSVSVFSTVYFGPAHTTIPLLLQKNERDHSIGVKNAFLKKIPVSSPVIATFEFLPRLADRARVYSFHHGCSGFYTLSKKQYSWPENLEYALLDFNDFLTFHGFCSRDYERTRKFLLDKWQVAEYLETIVLLKRGAQGFSLCHPIYEEPSIQNKSSINVDGDIELIGYNINNEDGGNLDVSFFWRCLKETGKNINFILDVLDLNGNLATRKMLPICYRIFPTQSWKKGELYRDNYRIRMPGLDKYKIKIAFFDHHTKRLCRIIGPVDAIGRSTIMEKR